jgi:hypothetical protein
MWRFVYYIQTRILVGAQNMHVFASIRVDIEENHML